MDYPAVVASITKIDRRFIYLLVGLAVAIPLLVAHQAKVEPTEESMAFHMEVSTLGEGDVVLLSTDYDAGGASELSPMVRAFATDVFRRGARLVVLSLNAQGTGLVEAEINKIAAEYDRTYGVDWVFLGFRPSTPAVILALSASPHSLFPQDFRGNELAELPLTAHLNGYRDFSLICVISSGATAQDWVIYGHGRFQGPMVAGLSGGIGPAFQSFVDTHQIAGVLVGLRGAAEYEQMLELPGEALRALFAQSLTHMLFVALIMIGNISLLATRWIENAMR